MFDWLNAFADPTFMPHGHCYLWRPEILWTHVISDGTIAFAYYAIPVVLAIFLLKRRQQIPYPEILGLFVAFIFLCGTLHLSAIATVWYPAYEPQGWLKALTALVSIGTALALIPRLPELLSLPGVKDAYDQAQTALGELEARNSELESQHNAAIERETRVMQLKQEINELLEERNLAPRYSQAAD